MTSRVVARLMLAAWASCIDLACAPLAAAPAGADALLIEVHCDPNNAWSDGAQSLFPEQFAKLMDELRIIAPAVGRAIG